MTTYFKLNSLRFLYALLVCNLLFSGIALAQAKEPWKGAYTSPAFAGGAIRDVYCDLVGETEASFGALQFIVGGIMAFGYAVFGDTKKTYSIIMAGIIGATMSSGISLYFGNMCGAGANQRTIETGKQFFSGDDSGAEVTNESEDSNSEALF